MANMEERAAGFIENLEHRTAQLYYWLKAARQDPSVSPQEFATVAHEYKSMMSQLTDEMIRHELNSPRA